VSAPIRHRAVVRVAVGVVAALALTGATLTAGQAAPFRGTSPGTPDAQVARPDLGRAVAHDESAPLRRLAERRSPAPRHAQGQALRDPGPRTSGGGFTGDPTVQSAPGEAAIAPPVSSFEGLSNQDNQDELGFQVNPPDPVGDVGPDHYVEMVNIVFSVYDKAGNQLVQPTALGDLWAGFAVDDCTDSSGDPIVVYDQFADRWILTQFSTRGPEYYNCVAISTSGDPTGSYYRYAFSTGENFPDYPKYGVWTDTYSITTREFGPDGEYGIGVYGLEKSRMLQGRQTRVVDFFLDGNDPDVLPLVGDGLLPADIDGDALPDGDAAIPLVGTQDDGGGYGATLDALNIWDFSVEWAATPTASLELADQLPTAPFDSIYPCRPGARDCLPQPKVRDRKKFLDVLSYRQRPTWRLAYRNFGGYESMVTNQSVEAAPSTAGVRWYEIRRTGEAYSVHQQGTYAPTDGVHRWMGSIAQDAAGNMALGYSVVNGTDVFPGIRYTGRLASDPPGVMGLGEGTIIDGSGIQRSKNSRWGDYTSMNVDPVDDCTFWYVNEYYTRAGERASKVGWQTRVASLRLPGC